MCAPVCLFDTTGRIFKSSQHFDVIFFNSIDTLSHNYGRDILAKDNGDLIFFRCRYRNLVAFA